MMLRLRHTGGQAATTYQPTRRAATQHPCYNSGSLQQLLINWLTAQVQHGYNPPTTRSDATHSGTSEWYTPHILSTMITLVFRLHVHHGAVNPEDHTRTSHYTVSWHHGRPSDDDMLVLTSPLLSFGTTCRHSQPASKRLQQHPCCSDPPPMKWWPLPAQALLFQ